jgi:hypothetical protein
MGIFNKIRNFGSKALGSARQLGRKLQGGARQIGNIANQADNIYSRIPGFIRKLNPYDAKIRQSLELGKKIGDVGSANSGGDLLKAGGKILNNPLVQATSGGKKIKAGISGITTTYNQGKSKFPYNPLTPYVENKANQILQLPFA